MTRKEMSEIFAVLLLAYPNAEVFKGGIQKLAPTIDLWTRCLPEVDFWTGQQAVIKLCRECKFPPTIAEFKEKTEAVRSEVKSKISSAWTFLKFDLDRKSPQEVFDALRDDDPSKMVIAAMGGPGQLILQGERLYGDGRRGAYEYYNYDGFTKAYEQLLRREKALPGSRPAIPAGTERR